MTYKTLGTVNTKATVEDIDKLANIKSTAEQIDSAVKRLESINLGNVISDEQIVMWNNKSDFNGNYSSLTGIPTNLATTEFVSTKLSKKANLDDNNKLLKEELPTLNKSDIGLNNVPNYSASSSLTDNSDTKLATTKAIKLLYDEIKALISISSMQKDEEYKVINFDTFKEIGVWIINVGASIGSKPEDTDGILTIKKRSDSYVVYTFQNYKGEVYHRGCNNGSLSRWLKVWGSWQ